VPSLINISAMCWRVRLRRNDGPWPSIPVRETIEMLRSEHVERAFAPNATIAWRPFSGSHAGGDDERVLAKQVFRLRAGDGSVAKNASITTIHR